MKIKCPICNQKQKFTIKLLFKERCNSCNEKFYYHYRSPIKLFRFIMQALIIFIGIYFSTTIFLKLLMIPIFFMLTEIVCLFSLKE